MMGSIVTKGGVIHLFIEGQPWAGTRLGDGDIAVQKPLMTMRGKLAEEIIF